MSQITSQVTDTGHDSFKCEVSHVTNVSVICMNEPLPVWMTSSCRTCERVMSQTTFHVWMSHCINMRHASFIHTHTYSTVPRVFYLLLHHMCHMTHKRDYSHKRLIMSYESCGTYDGVLSHVSVFVFLVSPLETWWFMWLIWWSLVTRMKESYRTHKRVM